MAAQSPQFHAPIFLGAAFFVFGLAILEKVLNLFNWTLPWVGVFPRQLLDWAVALIMFEIALSVRQLIEMRLEERNESRPGAPPGER
ncbi:MAG TPA: hypothetical protein VEH83_07405 [Gemmatimonadales bacterium]|nr:hypothetical protein [Gemmatimonadales bacterium]